jgi:hypothetical protein
MKTISHDGVVAMMNSAGYAIRVDAGIVYNDNKVEYDTITKNIVDREIGGTGNNQTAQKFARRLVSLHKQLDCNYVLAFIPRGDKTMPQGGSHSKQRILNSLRSGDNITVIEVSGKQTKMFGLHNNTSTPEYRDAEHICKNIKETKITDVNGKSHGSGVVFEHI